MNTMKEKIKETYAEIVRGEVQDAPACCTPIPGSSCCNPSEKQNGFSEDYSKMEGYVSDADFGLGCGIPVAEAQLKKGQTVLDLGSGAGNDVFVARQLVGDTGRVYGIDMTPAMVERANANKRKLGFENVEFLLADIESIPESIPPVDVVISNCVLNLVSDKAATYRGIYHVLKPGGHFTISDVVLSGSLPDRMRGIAELYAGCIAGALEKKTYLDTIKAGGFEQIRVVSEKQIYLPDSFLLQFMEMPELLEFRNSGVQVLSITVYGKK